MAAPVGTQPDPGLVQRLGGGSGATGVPAVGDVLGWTNWLYQYIPPDLQNDARFAYIITSAAYGESSLDPGSLQKFGGTGGHGLFQFDNSSSQGRGFGLTAAQLVDPDYQARIMVPLFAVAYRNAPTFNSDAELASWVDASVEFPLDWQNPQSAARQRYITAYNFVTQTLGNLTFGQLQDADGATDDGTAAPPPPSAPAPPATVGPLYADQIAIDLVVFEPDGSVLHLDTGILEQLTWTEQPGEIPMRLEAIVPNVMTDNGPLQQLLPLNALMQLTANYGDGAQPVQDFVIRRRRLIDDGHQTLAITAYDPLWELNKDECVYLMSSAFNPALSIIERVLVDRGVPVVAAPGPNTVIWQRRFIGMTRLAMIQQVLEWAWQRALPGSPDVDPYFIQWRNGGVTLAQTGKNANVYWVNDVESISRFEHDTSIEDLVTEVYIFSPQSLEFASTDPADNTLGLPFGALVPDETKDYAKLAQFDPDNPPSNINIIAQEATDLFALAAFQQAQKYAKIRKVINANDTDNVDVVFQQALDILNLQGIPWDIKTIDTILLPRLRRGDYLRVTAGDMDGIGLVTGVEHDATAWTTHVTMDSSGIFGRRIRRQHFFGPLPGTDGDLNEEDIASEAAPSGSGGAASVTLNDPSQYARAFTGRFDVNQKAVIQSGQWQCSAASTAWLLHTVGFLNITELDVIVLMGGDAKGDKGGINNDVGLAHADGSGLAAMLSQSPFLLNPTNGYLTYDSILALAGTGTPFVMGGHAWNHWTGVRGRDGDNLILANPSPGYRGVNNTFSRDDASRLGPLAVVSV